MTYIKFADGTQLPIDEGARLDRIVYHAPSAEMARIATAAVSDENLTHVEFFREGDVPHGVYDSLNIKRPVEVTDDLQVVISLTEHAVENATEESATEED